MHAGIDCEGIFLAFHPCLFSLVAILIQESYVLSFAHVPTVGHGLAESATGQLNFGHRSDNFGHGSVQFRPAHSRTSRFAVFADAEA